MNTGRVKIGTTYRTQFNQYFTKFCCSNLPRRKQTNLNLSLKNERKREKSLLNSRPNRNANLITTPKSKTS